METTLLALALPVAGLGMPLYGAWMLWRIYG
jgi:hypothetical protein